MSTPVPYQQPPAHPAGPPAPSPEARAEANKLALAVEAALTDTMKTSHRDTTPLPVTGTAPPVAQPGRPPMSQRAVDDSTRMLSFGVMTTLVGGTASLVMVASGHADPTVCGIVFGAPPLLALALSRLARRAKEVVEAVPPEHHHHYEAPVYQDHSTHTRSENRGFIATTRNNPTTNDRRTT